jgi:hypothetical protein
VLENEEPQWSKNSIIAVYVINRHKSCKSGVVRHIAHLVIDILITR